MRKLNIINNVNTKSDSMRMTSPPHLSDQALSLCCPPLTVSTSSHLQSLYSHCPPGTVVFLQPEQTLVFKVDVGWRYIVAGGLVSNSDTGRNLKEEETFVYDSPAFSNRDYKWK